MSEIKGYRQSSPYAAEKLAEGVGEGMREAIYGSSAIESVGGSLGIMM